MSSALLQVSNASKRFGAKELFKDATFSVGEGEHIGVIGPNGAGKSTLFKILLGRESLDSGQTISSKQLRVGYLAQEDDFSDTETVEAYVERKSVMPLWDLKNQGRYLGLTDSHWQLNIRSLSGGYQMRVKLMALLGAEPNLMLLDEPTNYLDLETLLVLERFLLNYNQAFLLISHDREFLRRVTDHTLEVDELSITMYPGTIDDYFEQKALMREQLEKRKTSLDAKKSEILAFAAKFGAKATKAKQAQSRLKRLDKMETIEVKALPVRTKIIIPAPIPTGQAVTRYENVSLGYGSKLILKDVNVTLNRGDKIAVIGLNGAGKSTFLKSLCSELVPLSGTIQMGHNVSFGYFAQHVALRLRASETVYEALARAAHPDVLKQDILDLAGALLFSGAMVDRTTGSLSGGEKTRVALGQILLQRSPCLVLDEPTNHLDFDTVEALTQALVNYPGTIIFVSHDRGFVRRIATKILEVNRGQLSTYYGSFDDYVWSLQQGMLADREEEIVATKKSNESDESRSSVKDDWEKRKETQKQLRAVEKLIHSCEKETIALNSKISSLTEALSTSEASNIAQLGRELSEAQKRLATVEEQWMAHLEEQANLQNA